MDNKIDLATKPDTFPATIAEVTAALATNLAQSEPFLKYKAAEEALNADADARRLLEDLSELQQKIRNQQYSHGSHGSQGSGCVTEEDLNRLHELQNQVGTNETIQAYGYAQEIAIAFLREVNQEISSLLGIDFASLTRRSGCC